MDKKLTSILVSHRLQTGIKKSCFPGLYLGQREYSRLFHSKNQSRIYCYCGYK